MANPAIFRASVIPFEHREFPCFVAGATRHLCILVRRVRIASATPVASTTPTYQGTGSEDAVRKGTQIPSVRRSRFQGSVFAFDGRMHGRQGPQPSATYVFASVGDVLR